MSDPSLRLDTIIIFMNTVVQVRANICVRAFGATTHTEDSVAEFTVGRQLRHPAGRDFAELVCRYIERKL